MGCRHEMKLMIAIKEQYEAHTLSSVSLECVYCGATVGLYDDIELAIQNDGRILYKYCKIDDVIQMIDRTKSFINRKC